ncbi:MAG: HAMP domain-containing sensor histidine kinase [Thermodesulfobacteriota bacterium]
MRFKPSLRSVLLVVNLAILLLPVGEIAVLRLYESELVRQTESELIAQGAVISATFRELLWEHVEPGERTGYGTPVASRFRKRAGEGNVLDPFHPHLDLADELVRPPAEDALVSVQEPDPAARVAGERIRPIIDAAKKVTLAGLRVLDHRGTVVATTGIEYGMSLISREEVRRALQGEQVSLLRERVSDGPKPALRSISRGGLIRVFVVIPVVHRTRVIGAVYLSRTPLDVAKALFPRGYKLLRAAGVLLVVVIAVSALTSMTITRPMEALVRQAARVSKGDNEAAKPLDKPRTKEVEVLSAAFAEMAVTLNRRTDQVRAFASNVSHAFKTPLTSIRGTAELLRDHFDTMAPEDRDRFLHMIETDADRMSRLVGRLLELARAEVTAPSGQKARLETVVETLVARYRASGMPVTCQLAAGGAEVCMAPETLESILSNLVDNGITHGGEGTRVELVATRPPSPAAGVVEVVVRDNGRGVAEAHSSHIFTPLFTTARETGGTGLGLAIVSALVSAHGGEITFHPGNPGAQFAIRLPSARSPGDGDLCYAQSR